MITTEELEQMKERAEKATAGNWCATLDDPYDRTYVLGAFNGGVTVIADIKGDADAQFLVHAREDVPRLVAEVERLNRRLALVDEEMLAQFWVETSGGYVVAPEYEAIKDTVQEVTLIACGAPITGEEEFE